MNDSDTPTIQVEALRQQVRALQEEKESFLRKEALSKSMITELEKNVENYRRENGRLNALFNQRLDFDVEREALKKEIDELKQKLVVVESQDVEFVNSLNSVINEFARNTGGSIFVNSRKRPRLDTSSDADLPHSSSQANNHEIAVFNRKIADLERQLSEQKNNYERQIEALTQNSERLQTVLAESRHNLEQHGNSQARVEELLARVHELETNLQNTETELYAEYDVTEAFATFKMVLQPILDQMVDTVLSSCERMGFNELHEETIQLLQRAGKIEELGRKDHSKLRSIWEQLYHLSWEAENYEVALEAATKRIELRPNAWLLYSRRASIHARLGNRQLAREDLLRVHAIINSTPR